MIQQNQELKLQKRSIYMKSKIKVDKGNVLSDIVIAFIPLVCLIFSLKNITVNIVLMYLLVAGIIYYIPLAVTYFFPYILIQEEYLNFNFLFYSKKINVLDIDSYSRNNVYRKTVFCKSSCNFRIYLKNEKKSLNFSIVNIKEFDNFLRKWKIPQHQEECPKPSMVKRRMVALVIIICLLIADLLFIFLKNENKLVLSIILIIVNIFILFSLIYICFIDKKAKK